MTTKKSITPKLTEVVAAIPEGYVVDFLTNKFVKDTSEEYVRQNIEKALVYQYKYDPNDCKPEKPIKMGSAKPRVDVAIYYPDSPQTQENIYAIIETKRPGTKSAGKKDGIGQLQSYMSSCPNAKFGLWTNGDDRYCFSKQTVNGKIEFKEILDLPHFGETEESLYTPSRRDLTPATADNLLFSFRRCHNYIAGTEGFQKQEAFWELLKIIFCKIEDERSAKLEFYTTSSELTSHTAAGPVKKRIQDVFDKKVLAKYTDIFKESDKKIQLKANVIAYVVGQLQRYSLLASSVDVKGIAYEEIVGSNLRGDRGEFFTPRNACRMAVEMLSPQPGERLLDPSCGTGGFLITAMNYSLEELKIQEQDLWLDKTAPTQAELEEYYRKRSHYLSNCVFGIDLNPALVRASKMNMVLNNDGEGNLFQADTLVNPHNWNPSLFKKISYGSIDVIVTNPPFGANIVIDDEEVLHQFELARVWDKQDDGSWIQRRDASGMYKLQSSQPPEILFLERCLQLLKPGSGRMAAVIPNGILNNPALGYVRSWLLQNAQIMAVVDMARDLFQPKNDTQTSMVLLRKLDVNEKQLAEKSKLQYPVFMAVTQKIGHDKRGNTIYQQAPNGDDLLVTRSERTEEFDPKQNRYVTVVRETIERKIDDELPQVAVNYLAWLQTL